MMQACRRKPEEEDKRVAATWRGVVWPWLRRVASAIDWLRTVAASGVNVCCIVIKSALISTTTTTRKKRYWLLFFFLYVILMRRNLCTKSFSGPAKILKFNKKVKESFGRENCLSGKKRSNTKDGFLQKNQKRSTER